jgi:hypothetical protein
MMPPSILNPLLHGIPCRRLRTTPDSTAGIVSTGFLLHSDGKAQAATFSTRLTGQAYQLSGKAIPEISGQIGLGIQTYDPSDGSTAYCGPYSLKLLVDGRDIYAREMSRFSFDNTRYVNSLIDYPTIRSQNRLIHLLYVPAGNKTRDYPEAAGQGVPDIRAARSAPYSNHGWGCIWQYSELIPDAPLPSFRILTEKQPSRRMGTLRKTSPVPVSKPPFLPVPCTPHLPRNTVHSLGWAIPAQPCTRWVRNSLRYTSGFSCPSGTTAFRNTSEQKLCW